MKTYGKITISVSKYALVIFSIWTLLIGVAMWWNIQIEKTITIESVKNIARSNFNKDQAYRQWATAHGGVYVEPSQKTPPSPWMAHIPDRDVVTTDGKQLTLMNPAYMLREMMSDYSDLYGIKGRIVGIVYLNENNKADKWEEKAIRDFEKGVKERMELTTIDGEEYLRLMKPMIMNEKCQKCHGHLGFPNGTVRGGVSVSVPMTQYKHNENETINNIVLTYGLIWLIGILAIYVIAKRTITQQKLREKDLEEIVVSSEVFNNTLDAIFITDKQGNILRINKAFTDLTGYTKDEVIGKNPRILKSGYHDDLFYQNIWDEIHKYGNTQLEIWNRNKSGEVFVSIISISSVKDDEENDKYFIATLHDITARKNAEERVVHMAHYDPLTDLPNRVLFQDRFSHAIDIAKKENSQVALAFIDLDRFKNVNDTKGHPFGDKLLKDVATRIIETLNTTETVARLGGDEFTVIFESFGNIDDIVSTCHHLLDELRKEFIIESQSVYISASIGISIYPDDGDNIHDLIQHADTAMYKAKEEGKNRISFYTYEMTKHAKDRVELETSLQNAILNKEFEVYYQPKVLASDKTIIGMEALVRWNDPKKGLVLPNKFIPISEEMKIVNKIDFLVLEQVCKDMKIWKEMGYNNMQVAVNLSGYDLGIDNLYEQIVKVIQEYEVESKNIEFEITETYFVNFNVNHLKQLDRLKEYGFSLSIDDFGTGYSSLSNLNKLPINILKIDQEFIRSLEEKEENKKLVNTIITMAKSLDLQIIAEGVETDYQLEYLRLQGCDYIQGYLEGKPMKKSDFIEYLKKKS